MNLTTELDVIWAECWGLKGAKWRIWSEVCIEAVEKAGWQQCGYFRPWYAVMQTLSALKTYFQLICFPSSREFLGKREPYQNFLSSLITKSLISQWFLTYHTGIFPWRATLGGSPVNNRWDVIAAGLDFRSLSLESGLHYRNINVIKEIWT